MRLVKKPIWTVATRLRIIPQPVELGWWRPLRRPTGSTSVGSAVFVIGSRASSCEFAVDVAASYSQGRPQWHADDVADQDAAGGHGSGTWKASSTPRQPMLRFPRASDSTSRPRPRRPHRSPLPAAPQHYLMPAVGQAPTITRIWPPVSVCRSTRRSDSHRALRHQNRRGLPGALTFGSVQDGFGPRRPRAPRSRGRRWNSGGAEDDRPRGGAQQSTRLGSQRDNFMSQVARIPPVLQAQQQEHRWRQLAHPSASRISPPQDGMWADHRRRMPDERNMRTWPAVSSSCSTVSKEFP